MFFWGLLGTHLLLLGKPCCFSVSLDLSKQWTRLGIAVQLLRSEFVKFVNSWYQIRT